MPGIPPDSQRSDPRSDGANPLWGDLAALRKIFPDARYLRAVARRQLLFGVAIAAIVAPFTLLTAATRPLTYQSSATLAYDPRDAAGDALGPAGFRQVARRFTGVNDGLFLDPLIASVQLDPAPESAPVRLINALSRRLRPAGVDDAAAQKARRAAAVEKLERGINAWGDDESMLLYLTVESDTPELARNWTTRLVDAFIQKELRLELDRVSALEAAYAAADPETAEPAAAAPRASDEDVDRVARLQEREAALVDQIQAARTESTELTGATAKRRAELQGELARLKTTLGPSHPDVVAKDDELREFLRGAGGTSRGGGRALQEELASIRAKLRLAGAPSIQESGTAFDVHTRLLRLRADRSHLERQIKDPTQRTRLRVVAPAYLPPAAKKGRFGLMATALATTLLLAGGLAFGREALSGRAADAWRIAGATQLAPLAVFSWSTVRKASDLSPERLDRLRAAIGERKMLSSTPVRVYLTYRQLVRVMQQQCVGRRILFVSCGEGERLAHVLADFFRIYCGETGDTTVVLDLDGTAPLPRGPADGPSAGGGGDVCDLLAGAGKWADVRLARTLERPFDLVPPPAELTGDKVRGLRKAPAQKLLEALERSYKVVFVRGLKAQHALENAAFAAAATDVILLVDGKTARREELALAVADVGRDLVRGFVLVEE